MSRTPQDTKNAIIDAAVDLFCENGYDGTTTRMIAQKADVNEVTLFRHFDTKENLFKETLEREMDIPKVASRVPPFSHQKTKEENLTEVCLFIFHEMSKRSRLIKLLIADAPRRGMLEEAASGAKDGVQALSSILEKMGATEPHITAVMIQSFLVRSVLFKAFLGKDPLMELDEENISRMVKVLIHGMEGEKA